MSDGLAFDRRAFGKWHQVHDAHPVRSLGETVGQRAGVLNVGLEGIMLVGAFLGVVFAVQTGTPWGGLAAAIIGGT